MMEDGRCVLKMLTYKSVGNITIGLTEIGGML